MLSRSVLYHGTNTPLSERLELRAGPLTLCFELEGAFVRYVRLGDREVLRGVYAAVRDRDWGTVRPRVSLLEVNRGEESFHLAFDVEHLEGAIDFAWRGTLTGEPDGTIVYTLDGSARSRFLRNRIGLCVLHPAVAAGSACRVEHVDGAVEPGELPVRIAPHQPFRDLRAVSHEVLPGLWAEVRTEGDTFEMEDQRNWTDASFKTYSTPLDLPFPVEVAPGETVSQRVTLRLLGPVPPPAATPARHEDAVRVELPAGPGRPLPDVGLGVASHGRVLDDTQIERLGRLGLRHLRVDLDLSDPLHTRVLSRAAVEACSLDLSLEVALFLSDRATEELWELTSTLEQVRPPVARWLVFRHGEKTTGGQWVELARPYLSGYAPDAPVGGGTNAYFTELNRDRPPADVLDFIAYSVNPQVHAFDDASLAETLPVQGATVTGALEIGGGLPVYVTPVTLRPRFNPDATSAETRAPGEAPAQVDPRQYSLLGAGWALGSLKHLAEAGAAGVTYFETTGWRGIMGCRVSPPAWDPWPDLREAVFPMYHVLADVGELAGGCVVPSRSSDPLAVESLVLRGGGSFRFLLANLTGVPQRVRLQCPLDGPVALRMLCETTVEQAMLAPEEFREVPGQPVEPESGVLEVLLPPFAVARLDGREPTGGNGMDCSRPGSDRLDRERADSRNASP